LPRQTAHRNCDSPSKLPRCHRSRAMDPGCGSEITSASVASCWTILVGGHGVRLGERPASGCLPGRGRCCLPPLRRRAAVVWMTVRSEYGLFQCQRRRPPSSAEEAPVYHRPPVTEAFCHPALYKCIWTPLRALLIVEALIQPARDLYRYVTRRERKCQL